MLGGILGIIHSEQIDRRSETFYVTIVTVHDSARIYF